MDQTYGALQMKETCDTNGFILSGRSNRNSENEIFIPEEILALILSYVDIEDLIFKCRLVCHSWNWIIENLSLKNKAEREHVKNLKIEGNKKCLLPWYMYYWICKKNIFGRNLLNYNSEQDKCNPCGMKSNTSFPAMLNKDFPPHNYDFEAKTCYHLLSTYSMSDCKSQLIKLSNEGLIPKIMDEYQPAIKIREWFSVQFDCSCLYELKVCLLNEMMSPVMEYVHIEKISHWQRYDWKLVEHKFSNYGAGIRYIVLGHQVRHFWSDSYEGEHVAVKLSCSVRVESTC